jgi:molecular chaperone GrpE
MVGEAEAGRRESKPTRGGGRVRARPTSKAEEGQSSCEVKPEPQEKPAGEKQPLEELNCLRKALEEERRKSEDYLNRLKYLQADFENYRKRVERELDEAARSSNERLIMSLLSVVDELELAVRAGEKSEGGDTIISGVRMTLKKLYEALEREGLARIEAVGKPFDPSRHEAVLKVKAEGYPDGFVVEEVRKGFMFKGRVIRPSMVKVAFSPAKDQDNQLGSGGETS